MKWRSGCREGSGPAQPEALQKRASGAYCALDALLPADDTCDPSTNDNNTLKLPLCRAAKQGNVADLQHRSRPLSIVTLEPRCASNIISGRTDGKDAVSILCKILRLCKF